ncbi:site-specific integrase [Pseudoalteromonas sp. T1lg10]|uniref:site-specific integrase n=1 Tax=Pseudoalteromonas sp. T1lg10 TaxID=2077093 RepID=UPI000CF6D0F9|nr:site-specific integrase [Pseudoalteromonas sp. T1lg10]
MGIMASPQRHPKSGIYYFRMVVPQDLRPIIGKREFKASLGTTNTTEAKRLFSEHYQHALKQVELARLKLSGQSNVELSFKDCAILAERWYVHTKSDIEQSGLLSDYVSRNYDIEGKAGARFFGLADTLSITPPELDTASESELAELADDLSEEITSQLERESIVIQPNSTVFRRLAAAFLPYVFRLDSVCRARYKNDWSYEPVTIKVGLEELSTKVSPRVLPKQKALVNNSISSVLERFLESEKVKHSGSLSRLKTLNETSLKVERFIEIIGDKGIGDVSRGDVMAYRDTLLQLPKSKQKNIRSKPIDEQIELVKSEGLETISASTVKNSLRQLSTVFTYAVDLELLPNNPVFGVKVSTAQKKVEVEDGKGYTDKDIERLFATEVFKNPNAPKKYGMACYWVPLLCRYTGARLNEIAQLRSEDVMQSDTGIHYLNIRRGQEQSVKTDASLRHIPVSEHLLELGFIEFVNTREGWLFPELPKDKYGKKSTAFTKWWRGVLQEVGVDNTQPVHAFRHSFKTIMRSLGIPDTVSDAITGHAGKSEGDRYGMVTLQTKQGAVDRLPRLSVNRIF